MIEKERKETLLLALNKLEAWHEIQNEMGRLTAAFNFHQKDMVLNHFAMEAEDVSLEYADEKPYVHSWSFKNAGESTAAK